MQTKSCFSLIGSNLDALERLITYNARNGIRMFRISSDLIPFGLSLAEELPWQNHYSKKLESIGGEIRRSGMRASMHPGQYTVLDSTDESVADRASRDLDYHAKVLDGLGLGPEHKMILHLGGVYGDKERAKEHFMFRYKLLYAEVKKRLVLENDDELFNIEDVTETASATGMPAAYYTTCTMPLILQTHHARTWDGSRSAGRLGQRKTARRRSIILSRVPTRGGARIPDP
jgi:UV DNA damage endonuclease